MRMATCCRAGACVKKALGLLIVSAELPERVDLPESSSQLNTITLVGSSRSTKVTDMASTKFTWLMALVAGILVPLSVGCIPVTPLKHQSFEDKWHVHERYARVPILGPITHGGPVKALDPPTDDEVWHALERARPVQGGFPCLHEVQRNNVRIVTECIADYVDPPRVIPMIGPCPTTSRPLQMYDLFQRTKDHWLAIPSYVGRRRDSGSCLH